MSVQILLVGCGKMGRAMLDGWLTTGSVDRIVVVEPSQPADKPSDDRVQFVVDAGDIPSDFAPSLMVVAVKPQVIEGVLPTYRRLVDKGAAVLSIAAGTPIRTFQAHFGDGAVIVRAMPNTPAAIGQGTSVLVASANASPAQKAMAEQLIAAVGSVEWVDDEGLIDAVTALSGGGPAYVFLLVECLAEAGREAGLPADMSLRLARSTVIGSGALLDAQEEPAETLRRNVTSPAGTTEAALRVLMDQKSGIGPIITRAIAAAADRSRELAD